MPRRSYVCDSCDHTFEIYQPIEEKIKKKCPVCKKNKLYQDLSGIYVGIREVKSVGQLAERNTKKLGRYGYEEKIHQEEEQKKKNKLKRIEEISKKVKGIKPINSKDLENAPKIPETPKSVRDSIESIKNPKEKQKRIDKYIIEGK